LGISFYIKYIKFRQSIEVYPSFVISCGLWGWIWNFR